MGRKKTITLFNKNHISLVKTIAENIDCNVITFTDPSVSTKKNSYGNFKYSEKTQRIDTWTNKTVYRTATTTVVEPAVKKRIEERLKSPLGFYYTKVTNPRPEKKEAVITTKKIWRFYVQGVTCYELIYYTEYNGIKVDFETHPWELADNKSIEDHFITDLLNDLNIIIDDATTKIRVDENRLNPNVKEGYHSWVGTEVIKTHRYVGDMSEVKKEIFTDLFGYPDGPKYQTNEEKILAHGFDLKTSFRKM